MSSQEDRDARRERAQKARRSNTRLYRQTGAHLHEDGPTPYQRTRDRWSEDYIGTELHDEDYFQDHELDFNDDD